MSDPCPCDGERCRISVDDPRHGTENAYNNLKCRCRPCRDAWNRYFRTGRASVSLKRYRDRLTSEGRMRGYPNRKLQGHES